MSFIFQEMVDKINLKKTTTISLTLIKIFLE